jgi:hypothetical protein
MDNVLVDELTFMLKMHFHSIGPGIGLMPCFDEVQLIFAVLLIGTCFLITSFSVSGYECVMIVYMLKHVGVGLGTWNGAIKACTSLMAGTR